ncbi:MAG: hypothetical protein HY319_28050 [Armatimonadetes bacterium]|nr:hypothetical protein [Armatimonadota bacterium]
MEAKVVSYSQGSAANPALLELGRGIAPLVCGDRCVVARPLAEERAAYLQRRDETRKSLSRALSSGRPILLEGESPSVKLSLLKSVRWPDDPPLARVSAMSEPAELFGNQVEERNGADRRRGAVWRDGALAVAVQNNAWLVVDEVQNASSELAGALAGLAQPEPVLRIHKGNGREELLRPDPDAGFRMILVTGLALFRRSALESVLPGRLLGRLLRLEVERPPLGMRCD